MSKKQVVFEQVAMDYGDHRVLQPTDLVINQGEFLTILGPSGSGKTTILRLLGGFLHPSAGRILFEGKDISKQPPERRPFNTVFQDYALFPHMTVGENVAYSLRLKGERRSSRLRAASDALELVGLKGMEGRRITQLSGGQQQRVALARAIVAKPAVVLLDEPLSALDASLRHQMQLFLKSVQRKLGTTFVFVTHDQQEALSMSDRIVVMNVGHVVQTGSPTEIYQAPSSAFVAGFIGRNNMFEGQIDQRTGSIVLNGNGTAESGLSQASALAVRPEALHVAPPNYVAPGSHGLSLQGRVEDTTYAGSHYSYMVRINDRVLLECSGQMNSSIVHAVGDEVKIVFRNEDVRTVGPS